MNSTPLVSVGIPTYNRPEGVKRTLECITTQTYRNLEIIVSDNCSPSMDSMRILSEFEGKDSRIKVFRQKKNLGSFPNFNFVLRQATGKYFIWAADDDELENSYIERCVNQLEKLGEKYIACMMEAQYFWKNKRYRYFPEGAPFYTYFEPNRFRRIIYILNNQHGNLFYSVFRRDALFECGRTIYEIVNMKSINEIFIFLYVSRNGNWLTLPNIGWYKQALKPAVEQAKWEKGGGNLPTSSWIAHFRSLPYFFRYHYYSLKDIFVITPHLGLDFFHRNILRIYTLLFVAIHFCLFVMRKRPKLSDVHYCFGLRSYTRNQGKTK